MDDLYRDQSGADLQCRTGQRDLNFLPEDSPRTDGSEDTKKFERRTRPTIFAHTSAVESSVFSCESPRELGECLLDCLIGAQSSFLNLFTSAYSQLALSPDLYLWLHEKDLPPAVNLSFYAIRRRPRHELRTGLVSGSDGQRLAFHMDLDFIESDYFWASRGFLIDFDVSAPNDSVSEQVGHGPSRVGTIAFLPVRRLYALAGRELQQAPTIFDLESFAWVLLWAALFHCAASPDSHEIVKVWAQIKSLNRSRLGDAGYKKYCTAQELSHEGEWLQVKGHYGQPVDRIRPLFNRWLTITGQESTIPGNLREVQDDEERRKVTLECTRQYTEAVYQELVKSERKEVDSWH